jgi:signal transduction histidine kinase
VSNLTKPKNTPRHLSSDPVDDKDHRIYNGLAWPILTDKNTTVSSDVNKTSSATLLKKSRRIDSSDTPDAISVLWHELLTPLTLIKGYTSTLLEFNNAIAEEQRQQYLRGIESASNRVIHLLENLRNITRLEETEIIADRPISILELLRQTLAELQNQNTKHIIQFYPHAPIPRVKVDPEKIQQVIVNLLSNAVKYSPEGGDINVELRLVRTIHELEILFPNSPTIFLPSLVVSVADDGIGLPEGELEKIFHKFYRVNTKLTRSIPGAGLGLYICKFIVEAHGGRIWAANRLQGGSLFNFSLPLG